MGMKVEEEVKKVEINWDSQTDFKSNNEWIFVTDLYLDGSAVFLDKCHAELSSRIPEISFTSKRYHSDWKQDNNTVHRYEYCYLRFIGLKVHQMSIVETAIRTIAAEVGEME